MRRNVCRVGCSAIFSALAFWAGATSFGIQNLLLPADKEVDPVQATSAGGNGWNYSSGFEPSEGFVPGFIGSNVQPAGCGGPANPCWFAFTGPPASQAEPHIDTSNPHSGMQHLRISSDPQVPPGNIYSGNFIGADFPSAEDIIPQPAGAYLMGLSFSIDHYSGQSFRIQAQAPSQSNFTAAMLFSYGGGIYYLDRCDYHIEWIHWRSWLPRVHNQLRIELDPCNGHLRFFLNGGTGREACEIFGTSIEQVAIVGDNQPGATLDVDDLIVTSEGPCPVLGACCDHNGLQQGCVDGVLEADCIGTDKVWSAQTLCQDVECACLQECTDRQCGGDGCGGNCGSCLDGNLCNGSESCSSNGQCEPGVPLVCDNGQYCDGTETCHPSFGCVGGTPPNCDDGVNCTADTCDEVNDTCVHDNADCAIPTVSEWGLVVLTLALLIAGKAFFGLRKPNTA